MPPQKRAAARGRRDPALLGDQQLEDQAAEAFALGEPAEPDEFDTAVIYLSEDATVGVRASIPTTLAGMERYSIIEAHVSDTVQEGEDATTTAARVRDAARKQYWAFVYELEEDLRAFAEQEAAEAARIARATGQR